MINIALVIYLCAALAISLFIGIYTLFWSQNSKKNYFLLMQTMIIVYLSGYLMELTSTNAEEAYAGVKVLYMGANFTAVFVLFFVADYCNIRLHRFFVKVPALILSLGAALTMWTTKFHHLVYRDYRFETVFFNHLAFTPGPLYSVIHIYPVLCTIITMAMLLYQMKKWKNKYRRQLLIFFLCITIPFIAESLYYFSIVTGINIFQIYPTPFSLTIMSLCFYILVIRYNIFEVISIAAATAMEHIREGFVLVDKDNNCLSFNSAAAQLFPEIEKLPKGESILIADSWPDELCTMEEGSFEFSVSDGLKYYRASVSPMFAKNKTLRAKIILFGEITDSVLLMKKLENAAYIDALTGLYNRKHFSELANVDIERAIRLNQSVYVAMLDLDFFKNVNDTYGHAAGDMVLKTTGEIIHNTIRSYDLLGRYGGEEYVLLLTALDETEAYKLMERIRENMENTVMRYEGKKIKITCSIGLAKFFEKDTLEDAIKKADIALYAAKNAGRNQVKIHDIYYSL